MSRAGPRASSRRTAKRFRPIAGRSRYSPTQLSLKLLRNLGYSALRVEVDMRIPQEGEEEDLVFKRDLFGILDIIALKDGVTLGVQPTSLPNVSARVRKIQGSAWFEWLKRAGWRLEVHGWDLETPNGGVRVINLLERDAQGQELYPTAWSSVVSRGRRSRSRLTKQTELKL